MRLLIALVTIALALPAVAALPVGAGRRDATPARKVEEPRGAAADSAVADVQRRLDELRAHNDAMPDANSPPPGATAAEWSEYRGMARELEHVYELRLGYLEQRKDLDRERATQERQEREWSGFDQPGPYSVAMVDDLWSQVRGKDEEIEAARVERDMIGPLVEDARLKLPKAEAALRQAQEAREAAKAATIAQASWRESLADMRRQTAESRVATLGTWLQFASEALDVRRAERALLLRKAVAATSVSPLTAADRDAKIAEVAAKQEQLATEISKALDTESDLRERLNDASPQGSTTGPKSSSTGELDAASATVRALRLLNLAYSGRREMWQRRYEVENSDDGAVRQGSLVEVQHNRDRLALLRQHVASELSAAQAQVDRIGDKLADWEPEFGDQATARREQHSYGHVIDVLKRLATEVEELDGTLSSTQEAARIAGLDETWWARSQRWGATARIWMDSLWSFELLAVEDTVVVEGREVSGKRSVTVGKVVKVAFLLVIALTFTNAVTAAGQRAVLRWFPTRQSSALLWHRLFTIAITVGLVVLTLTAANIPLTVFAFLGGALAIGAGFGAQNILNNFISGLILLFEQPIKLGDIVEVDGVRGRVAAVGARCCRVHRFDGIDMLIPNSSFLEKNVTNWTLSDPQLRRTLTVGVAYGSPVAQALQLLERAAQEHPFVLRDPAPAVYLEEFADSSLLLRLDLWMDINLESNWTQVTSDVRRRIEELLTAADIVIAFPQRDVHLDAREPIAVKVVPPTAEGVG